MPKTHTATSTAVGAGAPCSGIAMSSPAAMPVTVPSTRRKPRTRVSPRDAVFTKIHQAAPTAQYQRASESTWPTPSAMAQATVAWKAWRVVGRASPRPVSAAGAAGGAVRRSMHHTPNLTPAEAAIASATAP